jgi:GMP synthase-like glutamine amidotransferase
MVLIPDILAEQNIQEIHRDHVLNPPPNFTLLGSSTVCPIQGMVRIYGSNQSAPPEKIEPSNIHILTVQGHPEFTAPIIEKIVDVRAERGIYDRAVAEKARLDAVKEHDGTGRVGTSIWKVLASTYQ